MLWQKIACVYITYWQAHYSEFSTGCFTLSWYDREYNYPLHIVKLEYQLTKSDTPVCPEFYRGDICRNIDMPEISVLNKFCPTLRPFYQLTH